MEKERGGEEWESHGPIPTGPWGKCSVWTGSVFVTAVGSPVSLRLSFLFKGCGLCTLSCDFVSVHPRVTTVARKKSRSLMPKVHSGGDRCSDRFIISLSPPPPTSITPSPLLPAKPCGFTLRYAPDTYAYMHRAYARGDSLLHGLVPNMSNDI